ncbi:MAG: glutamine amidotransferase [Myxococcota bacterium]
MTAAPLLIVKTGSAVAEVAARRGDFEAWLTAGAGLRLSDVDVLDVRGGAPLPPPGAHRAVLVTGSAAMASDHEPWSDRTAEWLGRAVEAGTWVLGVCYGHQLLAMGLGGRVGRNPRGREIGTIEVSMSERAQTDPLLATLPSPLVVQATHVEAVLDEPAGAEILGGNAMDPRQVVRFGERTWGVQFHPEFDADIMGGYIAARRDVLLSEGLDADELLARVRDSDHGRRLLRRFAELGAHSR